MIHLRHLAFFFSWLHLGGSNNSKVNQSRLLACRMYCSASIGGDPDLQQSPQPLAPVVREGQHHSVTTRCKPYKDLSDSGTIIIISVSYPS
ncbi:hypothetical protein V8C34DRAFT_288661 [Trichoderma compactum]